MNVRLAIPLLIQEGWTRHQEEVAKPPSTERTGWSKMEPLLRNAFRNISAILTTPSAPLRWLRIFFLMAQPPLLYQEGSCQPDIHSRLHIPRLQLIPGAYSESGIAEVGFAAPFDVRDPELKCFLTARPQRHAFFEVLYHGIALPLFEELFRENQCGSGNRYIRRCSRAGRIEQIMIGARQIPGAQRNPSENSVRPLRRGAIRTLQMYFRKCGRSRKIAFFECVLGHITGQGLTCCGSPGQFEYALIRLQGPLRGIVEVLTGNTEHAVQLSKFRGPLPIVRFLRCNPVD